MEPKVILLVGAPEESREIEQALAKALRNARVPHSFASRATPREGIAYVNETGFPDFIVCAKGEEGDGIDLLRHVRHAGKSPPIIVFSHSFTQDEARRIVELNGINIAFMDPRVLCLRVVHYASVLLPGSHARSRAS